LTGAGAVAAAAASLLACGVAEAFEFQSPKISKDTVRYREVALGEHRCGVCRLYRAPSSCLDVAGTISENCGCRIWLPKVA